MTFKEYKEINKKYNFSTMFNDKLKAMSKEDYEKFVKHSIEVYEDIFNDDSNDEDLMIYEKEIKTLEKALDKACKYTHNNGLNGCPSSYDCSIVSKKKEKECSLCKFNYAFEKYYFNKEYERKSKECWKEYFLKGERK